MKEMRRGGVFGLNMTRALGNQKRKYYGVFPGWEFKSIELNGAQGEVVAVGMKSDGSESDLLTVASPDALLRNLCCCVQLLLETSGAI